MSNGYGEVNGRRRGMKSATFLLVFVLTVLTRASLAFAQQSEAEVVRTDVRRAIEALYSGDLDTVLQYTHPRIVSLMGGEQTARETLSSGIFKIVGKMRIEKFSFPASPTFFEGQENQFVFVPTLSIIAVGGAPFESLNFQLGVRRKGESQWRYVEGSRVNDSNVRSLFPDFPGGVSFPSIYRRKL